MQLRNVAQQEIEFDLARARQLRQRGSRAVKNGQIQHGLQLLSASEAWLEIAANDYEDHKRTRDYIRSALGLHSEILRG